MPEVGPDIGTTLRETRMRARIDIGEVEMRTKIRAKYLRAIENEEWDLLPGPVYVKSFLRTYGDYLGLDSRALVDEYKRRYELAPDVQGRPVATVKRERERRGGVGTGTGVGAGAGGNRPIGPSSLPSGPSWAWVLVVLVAAGIGLYLFGESGSSGPKTSAAGGGHTGATTHPKQTTTHHTTTAPATKTTTTTALASKRATLKIVPTSDIWVCVESASGKPIVDGVVYSSGEKVPSASGSSLLVGLGNANATITINGKPYTPAAKSAIKLKVTPTKVSVLSSIPTCGQ